MGKIFDAIRCMALAALGAAMFVVPVQAKDFILTGAKPDKLVVIDAEAREVVHVHTVPESAPGLLTITPSPDGRIAYSVVNRWESISGIDIDTGEQVFRADLSSEEERVKVMFAMDISPNGTQLAAFLSSVKLLPSEFEVQPTRIAFFDTSAGLGATPVRTIPAPRQTFLIMYSDDGSKLYALGRAVHVLEPQTGDILETHATQGWGRENFFEPDIIDVWSQWEQAGIFSTPYYTARSDIPLDQPEAWVTGILTLDLGTGEFRIQDVENTAVFYFSSVVSPSDPRLVFGVYNTLAKFDVVEGKSLGSVELDHSYYAVNVSSDGSELYIGGTLGNVPVYSTETLERIGNIVIPGEANQAISSLRVISR
jgi:quinohemoprotein amine dehydrogenase beta subunit